MMARSNPYDWTRHRPRPRLDREPITTELVNQLLDGNGCVLIGGRGMGKSVLLQQIAERIRADTPEVTVVCFHGPSVPATMEGSLHELEKQLALPHVEGSDGRQILDRHFTARPEQQACVLLFDELDQYVSPRNKDSLARTLLNHLEAVRRGSPRPLGILIAGGLGLYVLRDYLASAFMSRVYYAIPTAFSEAELEELAAPFSQRGAPLSEGVIKSLHLASGGNPALATYGLQYLWERASCEERDVSEAYARLQEKHPDFLRDLRTCVTQPEFSEMPLRVWSLVRKHESKIPRAALLQALSGESGVLRMDLDDVLRLLRSAGLITLRGSTAADPLDLRAVTSILNLPEPAPAAGSLREQLLQDLVALLTNVYRWAPDFFHSPAARKDEPGKVQAREPKRIVPEAVFSAILAIGLEKLGWEVEREAQQGAGRTDLKLTRSGEHAIVEVKIWTRNDFAKLHAQVEGYWAPEVRAGMAVMLTDLDLSDFPTKYRSACLSDPRLKVVEEEVPPHSPRPLRRQLGASGRLRRPGRPPASEGAARLNRGYLPRGARVGLGPGAENSASLADRRYSTA